jgi:hypothetical protein
MDRPVGQLKNIGSRRGYGSTRGSIGFCYVVAPTNLLLNLDRSNDQVNLANQFKFNNYATEYKLL